MREATSLPTGSFGSVNMKVSVLTEFWHVTEGQLGGSRVANWVDTRQAHRVFFLGM